MMSFAGVFDVFSLRVIVEPREGAAHPQEEHQSLEEGREFRTSLWEGGSAHTLGTAGGNQDTGVPSICGAERGGEGGSSREKQASDLTTGRISLTSRYLPTHQI